ncbi:MAG: sulfide-dependent adenosine diphosphate thiazole synthase [Candidatus Omnitrophica bacterium]|nr:sulfide-dependent adenosine diphosphate thiazole synthase [Candidatus Omnitrophota bacterium]MDD5352971.1 sulfide-dependent adenosine diphosphate thiazole synthase [Candidatus Omnitrophota bacterium]MDD5550570.1 sulfide-dependent adenosine diphosphate thiazole synthase [Candidatus Omnitrophota bacterium]
MDEVIISRAIIESFNKDLLDALSVDVAIAGAGPSGLICAYYLAKQGFKVAIFERQLRVGGGLPGGGMMFNRIVIQEEAKGIMEEFDINIKKYKDDLYVADSLETISTMCSKTIKQGVKIFNLINVEDVVIRKDKITGLVLNWSAVSWSKLHVDPLAIKSKAVVDATGHDTEVCKIVERKIGPKLKTETGKIMGEKSMWVEVGEGQIVANTKEVYPGLVVCGMAANAVLGSPRMGAIFGGMFISGRKAAEVVKGIIKRK